MNEVLREIGMIARALDSISNIEFKELDLNRGQYLYLVRIYENPGIIQDQLAELIMVDRTTISRAINRLQEKGFIYRQEDPINKKIKRLYVTEKGQELYPYIMRENEYSTQTALAGLTAADIQQLQEALRIIRGNVSSDWEFVKKGNKRNY